jgi:hypothetical protein
MAPHAALAACVEPSSESSSEKNKNENFQGPLQPQAPSRAMTSQAMSAACVEPCGRSAARAKTAMESPGSLSGRPPQRTNHGGVHKLKQQYPPVGNTSVSGSSATPRTTAGSRTRSILQESPGGSAGNPGRSRASRHALTVAFELLRWHHGYRCPRSPSGSGRAEDRQAARSRPPGVSAHTE